MKRTALSVFLVLEVALVAAIYFGWFTESRDPEPTRAVATDDLFDPALPYDDTTIAGPPSRWP